MTDDQIDAIWEAVPDCSMTANYEDQRKFARAILASIATPGAGRAELVVLDGARPPAKVTRLDARAVCVYAHCEGRLPYRFDMLGHGERADINLAVADAVPLAAAPGAPAATDGDEQPAQDRMPMALADYSQEQVDALSHHEIADRLRHYNHPLLKSAADSIDYLAAQEDLLEQAQRFAERAGAELEETKRPLDEPMARLNKRVIELTAELDALRLNLKTEQS